MRLSSGNGREQIIALFGFFDAFPKILPSHKGFMLTLATQVHADTGVLVGLSADEQVARRLQAEYDSEMAAYLVDHPDDAAMRRMAGHAFNPSPQSSTNTAQSTASQSAQQGAPRPSTTSGVAPVRYPAIGSPTGHYLQSSIVLQSMSALWQC